MSGKTGVRPGAAKHRTMHVIVVDNTSTEKNRLLANKHRKIHGELTATLNGSISNSNVIRTNTMLR
jgi:hypothetical protein